MFLWKLNSSSAQQLEHLEQLANLSHTFNHLLTFFAFSFGPHLLLVPRLQPPDASGAGRSAECDDDCQLRQVSGHVRGCRLRTYLCRRRHAPLHVVAKNIPTRFRRNDLSLPLLALYLSATKPVRRNFGARSAARILLMIRLASHYRYRALHPLASERTFAACTHGVVWLGGMARWYG